MSKQCMNCGREISGVGNNKIFCDECFHLIASFLRDIQSENAPASVVFERNRSNIRAAGVNLETERYIERCCRRYDEKRAAKSAATVVSARVSADTPPAAVTASPSQPDPFDPFAQPAPAEPKKRAESPDPFDTESYDTYGRTESDEPDIIPALNPRAKNRRRVQEEDNGGTMMFEPVRPVIAPDPAMFAAAEADGIYGSGKRREENDRIPSDETICADAPMAAGYVSYGGESGGGGNGGGGDGGDDYSEDDDDNSKNRLPIIITAAVAVVLIFVLLIVNHFIGGGKPPIGDETTGGGNKPPHIGYESDSTTNPDDTGDIGPHAHVWADATCTAARTCSVCGITEGDPLGHDYGVGASCDKPATCRRCGASTGNALGHDWADPEFTWSNGNRTCTATFTCKRDAAHTESATAAVTTKNSDATCTEAGGVIYTAVVVRGDQTYSTETQGESTTPLGHDWTRPMYTWSADYSTCKVTLTCSRDGNHKREEIMTVSSTGTPPTCTVAGSATYTSTVNIDGKTYTDTQTFTSEALGHQYGDPVFTWGSDGDCKAEVVCAHDSSHKQSLNVIISDPKDSVDPTCTEPGSATYTASVTIAENEGIITKDYSDTKKIEFPALGHTFRDGEITCSVCGELRPELNSVGHTEFKDPFDDYSIMVYEATVNTDSARIYSVSYTLECKSEEEAFEQGCLVMVLKSGKVIEATVDTNYDDEISRGNNVEHTVTFEVPVDDEPLFLEYRSHGHSYGSGSQLFTENPEYAVYWKLG